VKLFDDFTSVGDGLPANPKHAIFGLDANWQIQNAVEYYMREHRPETIWFTTDQLEWLHDTDRASGFKEFVAANAAIGRTVVTTDRTIKNIYNGPPSFADPSAHLMRFGERVESVRRGTPYVLAILRSDQEYPLNTIGLARAWRWLAPGLAMPPLRYYTAIVGRVGEPPVLVESQDRPYRVHTQITPDYYDVRMESWLPTDTIRRAGFGHVIVNRRHALTIERGISFVAFGRERLVAYDSGPFAPLRGYIVPAQD
jgi:hypothetical protein